MRSELKPLHVPEFELYPFGPAAMVMLLDCGMSLKDIAECFGDATKIRAAEPRRQKAV